VDVGRPCGRTYRRDPWKMVSRSDIIFILMLEVVAVTRHPVFIDAIIQSNGAGFVGTLRSTMSTLARRRVQSWRDGAIRTISWGWPGADDH
jgi:hypothetical protein